MIFVYVYIYRYLFNLITGNMRPRIEKQKAPMRPMNGPIVGTQMAKTTAAVTMTVLKLIRIIRFILKRTIMSCGGGDVNTKSNYLNI